MILVETNHFLVSNKYFVSLTKLFFSVLFCFRKQTLQNCFDYIKSFLSKVCEKNSVIFIELFKSWEYKHLWKIIHLCADKLVEFH